MGIQPDFVVGRAREIIDDKRKEKVAYYCNVHKEDVISNPDLPSIYELPLVFHQQKFDQKVLKKLNLPYKNTTPKFWEKMVEAIYSKKTQSITVGIIAKYISTGDYEFKDSYTSLIEALEHACWAQNLGLKINFINAEDLEKNKNEAVEQLKKSQGVIVPIGWGERGVEGKIKAIKYARENKIPYLGLCYGMQLASVEFARNVVGLEKANTVEVDPQTPHPLIHEIPFEKKYQRIKGNGASMRLGAYDCVLKPKTLAYSIYEKHKAFKDKKLGLISERHRHRYEFNNDYREQLETHGFIFSGTSPDNFFVEMIELPQTEHPFFLATQAHPEYKSRPLTPHPIFVEYTKAVQKNKK